MNVSAVNLYDSMASQATSMNGSQVSMEIQVAVMKQMQDMEKTQAASLLKMMAQSGIGQNLNLSA